MLGDKSLFLSQRFQCNRKCTVLVHKQLEIVSRSFSTLKGEMIPYIIKKQSSRLNTARKDDDTNTSLDDERKGNLV